jgi:cation diffusion facilitator CzcD-associated flavoprotein CzcO
MVAEYLEAYCDQFDLRSRIRHHHEVRRVSPLDPAQRHTPWRVLAANTLTGEAVEAVFDLVVVASGKEWLPRLPEVRGRETFRGAQLHSKEYNKIDGTFEEKYRGRSVLVVGASVSGIDIAEELASVAEKIYIR